MKPIIEIAMQLNNTLHLAQEFLLRMDSGIEASTISPGCSAKI